MLVCLTPIPNYSSKVQDMFIPSWKKNCKNSPSLFLT